jgi:hypothetical protein
VQTFDSTLQRDPCAVPTQEKGAALELGHAHRAGNTERAPLDLT